MDSQNEDVDCIQPINRDTVHRICAGQVVLSLSMAVKELIENAIDANSTIIDIKLKEYGSDLIEVSDNGSGVLEQNFEALTLKHYTSKIRQFSELERLATLGFRGEALSSLCALSDLVVVTKHHSIPLATKIAYDRNGKIISKSPIARQTGTTVILENLFQTLPVRRKELVKNLKREFNKMCQLLYAYCLVSKGIRFTCTNLTNKGSKSTVASTGGHHSTQENITNVFGAKQISSLIEVDKIPPDETILKDYSLTPSDLDDELPFDFEFLISSVMHGSGRSSTDRQYYFINSRPCEPMKLMRLVNEIYKKYNSHQYPFVYLNITTTSTVVDVNITPDKRQVFIEKEKVLLAVIRASLEAAFKNFPSTFKMQNMDLSTSFLSRSLPSTTRSSVKRKMSENSFLKQGSILETFQKRPRTEESARKLNTLEPPKLDTSEVDQKSLKQSTIVESLRIEESVTKQNSLEPPELNTSDVDEKSVKEATIPEPSQIDSAVSDTEADKDKSVQELNSMIEIGCDLIKEDEKVYLLDSPKKDNNKVCVTALNTTLSDISELLQKKQQQANANNETVKVKFRCEITPQENQKAETQLRKEICKEDFKKMQILGQFNQGFVIVRLDNDLFIVDQHASDEKYNFETLQATTTINHQTLVLPKLLQLTAAQESVLMEHVEVFRKNGFRFKINETAPATEKVHLTAVPISKNIVFGKDDIDEMIFKLQESSLNANLRPSRVRAMFASRACRKSIMIGDILSETDMRRLIDHMGEIAEPWNCPHGRPTMRHLINLDLLDDA